MQKKIGQSKCFGRRVRFVVEIAICRTRRQKFKDCSVFSLISAFLSIFATKRKHTVLTNCEYAN